MSEDLLTPQELANKLGVKQSTIYHWTHIGYIPTVKIGNLIRFRWSSIHKWIEKQEKVGRVNRKLDLNKFI